MGGEKKGKKNQKHKIRQNRNKKQIIKIVLLTDSRSCGVEIVRERKRQKELSENRQERWTERGWGESRHSLRAGCTHRGGRAIGPGSTPPSFVLTPAAFPSVRLFPLPLSAAPVVVHVRGEDAWIVSFGGSMRLPFSFAVPFAESSVKWPLLRGAIVKTPTERDGHTFKHREQPKICRLGALKYIFNITNIPPWSYKASLLSLSPPSSVSVTAGGVCRWSSVSLSSSSVSVPVPFSVSVSVAVLVAASTVPVRRRVSSCVRHLEDHWKKKHY